MSKLSSIVTIEGVAFNILRSDFNQILRQTLNNMIQKEGEKAEVKISLKIALTQAFAPDPDDDDLERQILIPIFDHKVSSVMQYKEEKSGILGGAEYELIWDKEKREYVIRPIEDAQLSLFGEEDSDVQEEDNYPVYNGEEGGE